MKRRLDLAASLVGHPRVLFLDEPTTGLDPRSRIALWEVIAGLVAEGTTILLTTQYLEEADRLADKIAVIDLGKVIAEGTQDELKARIGGEVVEIRLTKVADRHGDLDRVLELLRDLASAEPILDHEAHAIRLPVEGGASILAEAVRRLDGGRARGQRAEPPPADARRRLPDPDRPPRRGRVRTDDDDGEDRSGPARAGRSAAAARAPEGPPHDRHDPHDQHVPAGRAGAAPTSTGPSPTRWPSPGGTSSSTSGSRSCSSSRRSSR